MIIEPVNERRRAHKYRSHDQSFFKNFILVFLAKHIPIDLILANGLQSVNLTQIYDARIKE